MPGTAELLATVVTSALLSLLAYPQTSYACWGSWTGRHATRQLRLKIAGAHAVFAIVVSLIATWLNWTPGDSWVFTGAAWGSASAALLRLDFRGGFETDRSDPALSALRYYVTSLEQGITRKLDPVVRAWAEQQATAPLRLVALADYVRLQYVESDGALGWREYVATHDLMDRMESLREHAEEEGHAFTLAPGEVRELVIFLVGKVSTYRIPKDWFESPATS